MFEEVFKEKEGTDLVDKNLSNFVPFKALTPGGLGAETGGAR